MNIRNYIAAALAVVALLSAGASVVNRLPVVAPSPASGILQGISQADAAVIRDFYSAMADVVDRDGKGSPPVVATTFDLRNRHAAALRMAFAATGLAGKYPGLGERIDAHLIQAIGDTDVPLSPEVRARAVQAFSAIK